MTFIIDLKRNNLSKNFWLDFILSPLLIFMFKIFNENISKYLKGDPKIIVVILEINKRIRNIFLKFLYF